MLGYATLSSITRTKALHSKTDYQYMRKVYRNQGWRVTNYKYFVTILRYFLSTLYCNEVLFH